MVLVSQLLLGEAARWVIS